jgi:hypothetical protein
MAGPIPETHGLKQGPAHLKSVSPVTDSVLIISDHRGSERFFLRFGGTADELQIWFERWANRSKGEMNWATTTWEHCGTPQSLGLELPRRGYRWSAQGLSPGFDNRQLERSLALPRIAVIDKLSPLDKPTRDE